MIYTRGVGRYSFVKPWGTLTVGPANFPAKPFILPLIEDMEPLLAHESEYERESS
jgi:hypothetical protein